MGINLEIPDSIAQAIRLPEENKKTELKIELSLALYKKGILSFGKARELAGLGKYEFGRLLGTREIVRHYSENELEDDIRYAGGGYENSVVENNRSKKQ